MARMAVSTRTSRRNLSGKFISMCGNVFSSIPPILGKSTGCCSPSWAFVTFSIMSTRRLYREPKNPVVKDSIEHVLHDPLQIRRHFRYQDGPRPETYGVLLAIEVGS